MSVDVQKLDDRPISDLIFRSFGELTLSPREAEMLDYCQSLGDVYIGYVDDEFVCCWGLIPPSFLSTQAYIWLWSPAKLPKQFVFIRQSQIQVQALLRRYETIIGHCQTASRSAQRWLRWLGAEFGPPEGHLTPFTIRRPANG